MYCWAWTILKSYCFINRYKSLPRKYLRNYLEDNKTLQGTLDDFVHHSNCVRCDKKTEKGVCASCDNDVQKTTSFLLRTSLDISKKLDTACQVRTFVNILLKITI